MLKRLLDEQRDATQVMLKALKEVERTAEGAEKLHLYVVSLRKPLPESGVKVWLILLSFLTLVSIALSLLTLFGIRLTLP